MHNEFLKLEQMLEFLYRTAARLSQRDKKHSSSNSKISTFPSAIKKPSKSTASSLTTTTLTPCLYCRTNTHPLFRCEKFRSLPVSDRIQVVSEASICTSCIREGHEEKQCEFDNCLICNQQHNTLLHQEPKPPNA